MRLLTAGFIIQSNVLIRIVPPQAVDLCKVRFLVFLPEASLTFLKHPAVRNYDLSTIRYVMIGAVIMWALLLALLTPG